MFQISQETEQKHDEVKKWRQNVWVLELFQFERKHIFISEMCSIIEIKTKKQSED